MILNQGDLSSRFSGVQNKHPLVWLTNMLGTKLKGNAKSEWHQDSESPHILNVKQVYSGLHDRGQCSRQC